MRTAPNAAISGMVVMLGMLSPGTVQAAEITVLASQGVVSAVRDLAPAFERVSGHKVVVSFEVGPGLMNKVNSNAPADVVTHYPDMIDDLIKKGKVLAGTVVTARAASVSRYGQAHRNPTSARPMHSSVRCWPQSPSPIHVPARAASTPPS